MSSPRQSRALLGVATLWLLVALWLFSVPPARAQEGAVVSLSPSSIALRVGESTTVSVRIDNINNLYGIDVRLRYDPAVVRVEDADPSADGVQVASGPLFPSGDSFIAAKTANNDLGIITYAAVLLHSLHPSPLSGSGVLFSVTFRGIAEGNCALTLIGHELVSKQGEKLPSSVRDGSATVSLSAPGEATATPTQTATPAAATPTATAAPAATATATPTKTATPAATPTATGAPAATPTATPGQPTPAVEVGSATVNTGDPISIPVTVKDITIAAGLGTYDFTINYNPAVINLTGCAPGDAPFGEPGDCFPPSPGTINVNDYISGMEGPTGTIRVVSLMGTAAGSAGSTPLTVTINTLATPLGDDITPRSAVKGSVTVLAGTATPAQMPSPGAAGTPQATVQATPTIAPGLAAVPQQPSGAPAGRDGAASDQSGAGGTNWFLIAGAILVVLGMVALGSLVWNALRA